MFNQNDIEKSELGLSIKALNDIYSSNYSTETDGRLLDNILRLIGMSQDPNALVQGLSNYLQLIGKKSDMYGLEIIKLNNDRAALASLIDHEKKDPRNVGFNTEQFVINVDKAKADDQAKKSHALYMRMGYQPHF